MAARIREADCASQHAPVPARRTAPARRSPVATAPEARVATKRRSAPAAGAARNSRLARRVARLLETEIAFIPNPSFVGLRSLGQGSDLARRIERGESEAGLARQSVLPAHLSRMCATPLLSPAEERELFQRMNYCKYRANALRSRLRVARPDADKVSEIEALLACADRLRNHLIQANTRLVMSIARRFADQRNAFDDLLSQGVASLMHAVEKFDYERGYRFSTYATCAVRRDLYRMVMSRKRDSQRFTTGAAELLGGCPERGDDQEAMTEGAWRQIASSVRDLLGLLDERERVIVTARFGLDDSDDEASYSRLGDRLGISKERVRQLANRALDKMRDLATQRRLEALIA